MDYSKLSDFEINRRVAELIGKFEYVSDCNHNGGSSVLCDSIRSCHEFDPCNDPIDAWSIIVENRICITSTSEEERPWCAYRWGDNCEAWGVNPLRQCMIVYLMMQEAQC